MPLATAQVQFSLLSRGPDQMTTQAVCRDLGITLIAYSPLGLGALSCYDAVCSQPSDSCTAGCLMRTFHLPAGTFNATWTMCPEIPVRMLLACACAGMLTGKYSPDRLPAGPRGILFSQIMPGLQPLLDTMQKIAARRRKTMSQVREPLSASTCRMHLLRHPCLFPAGTWHQSV